MSCFLYILKSKTNDIYYTGQSENPPKRLSFHNSIEKGFTARYRPWRIVFQQEFPDRKKAKAAERKVKSWKSKKMIQKLIDREINIKDYL